MVWQGCIAPPKSHFRPRTDQLRDRITSGHHPTPTERDCEWARPSRACTGRNNGSRLRCRPGRNNGLVIGRASRALVNPQGANANGEWTGCKGHWLSIPRVSVSPQYPSHGPRNDAARRPRVAEVWGVVPRNSAWSGQADRSSSSRAG